MVCLARDEWLSRQEAILGLYVSCTKATAPPNLRRINNVVLHKGTIINEEQQKNISLTSKRDPADPGIYALEANTHASNNRSSSSRGSTVSSLRQRHDVGSLSIDIDKPPEVPSQPLPGQSCSSFCRLTERHMVLSDLLRMVDG